MPESIATSPEIVAEVALLWLREKGGFACADCAGRLWVGLDACPIAFAAFEALERRGLVRVGSYRCELSIGATIKTSLFVILTDAGRAEAVSAEAQARYRRLMHGRFED